MSQKTDKQPWQWTDDEWKAIINRVRGGKTYKPKQWKNGARCAVALSFDSDHETNELREGGKSYGRLQWGQYGNRVAMPKILNFLAKEGIPSSIIDASDRNHGEINQWFGRSDDTKVTAKAWEFLDPLAKAE